MFQHCESECMWSGRLFTVTVLSTVCEIVYCLLFVIVVCVCVEGGWLGLEWWGDMACGEPGNSTRDGVVPDKHSCLV